MYVHKNVHTHTHTYIWQVHSLIAHGCIEMSSICLSTVTALVRQIVGYWHVGAGGAGGSDLHADGRARDIVFGFEII